MAKHRYLLILVCCAMGTGGFFLIRSMGENSSKEKNFPDDNLLTADSLEKDFGVISPKIAILEHTFTIQNQSQKPLQLITTSKGCNCLEIAHPETIMGGNPVPVKVVLETRNQEGPFSTSFVVAAKDFPKSSLRFHLKFYCQPLVRFVPDELIFFDVVRGTEIQAQLEIIFPQSENEGETPLPFIQTGDSGIQCKFLSKSKRRLIRNQMATIFAYLVKMNTNKLITSSANDYVGAVGIHTLGQVKYIPFRITYAHHQLLKGISNVTLSSKQTFFKFKVWSRDGKPIPIMRISSSCPELLPQKTSLEPAVNHEIQIFVKSLGSKGDFIRKEQILLFCDDVGDNPYKVDVMFLP